MDIDIAFIFLGMLLILAAVIDLKTHRIPNLLTLPTILTALIFHTLSQGAQGFFFSLAGAGAGIGLLVAPYLMGGMGAGDAKLMGAVGAVVGAKGALVAFLLTAIAGGIYSAFFLMAHRRQFSGFLRDRMEALQIFLLTHRYIPEQPGVAQQRPRLCYGVAIALGSITYILLTLSGHSFLL
jgi:prepilin peptidase CpaA